MRGRRVYALTIDAEEVARLELSFDLMKKFVRQKSLKEWDGFGLAVQAYQKRAPAVIEWAETLSRKQRCRLWFAL